MQFAASHQTPLLPASTNSLIGTSISTPPAIASLSVL